MNTLFLLMAEYETADIPLKDISDKYFGMCFKKAADKARTQDLPVPVYRCGSQKSQLLVSAKDLADLIDARRDAAAQDKERLSA